MSGRLLGRRRGRQWQRVSVGLVAVVTIIAGACTPAPPPVPLTDPRPAPGTPLEPARLDCARWRYGNVTPGVLPAEWNPDDYRFTSARDGGSQRSPHRLCGQLGAAVDLAWSLERGLPSTVIAVLDSGVEWRDADVARELAPNTYLNRGELPVPEGPLTEVAGSDPAGASVLRDPYDRNGDGRFSVEDYGLDDRVTDRNGNEMLDPEDLILTPEFNDGIDSDGNGYVDDISGWDLLHDDNNPLDDVQYGHGSGEARDSTAAHDGEGAFGTCVDCSHLPVRVSDSFMAEGARFAAGVLFALDSGASVVQEALGAVTNPPQAQQAIDAAYASGVPVVASMADEQSQHANLPAAANHTIPVNSVTQAMDFLGDVGTLATGRRDTLALNGCTNYGAIAWVSVPSNGCSSEATGNSAGMVGLVVSAATRAGIDLSANEAAQILRASADDVDFATPNPIDRANDMTDDFGQRRFPSALGWDATYGYGRINAYEAVKLVTDRQIPPEADLTSPRWFAMEPASGTVPVLGRVGAPRSASYSYRVEWTTGLQTPPYPARDEWRIVEERHGLTEAMDGELATLDLATLAAALPANASGPPVRTDGKPDADRFTIRLRVVTTDAEGRVATMHRQFSVHDDPTLVNESVLDGAGMSSPAFADINGDGRDEMVLGTDDGYVHVLDATGADLPGFPQRTPPPSFWHGQSVAAQKFGIAEPGSAIGVGAPAVADTDGDGTVEIVVSDLGGSVTWWSSTGLQLGHVRIDERYSRQESTDRWNRVKSGIMSSVALSDLDGDGTLEMIVAAMDRHVYAWHSDGESVEGFPVLLVDPHKVESIDPQTHRVKFRSESSTGIGGELVATPSVGDLDGDGLPEIVVGAQEQYDESPSVFPAIGLPGTSGNTRLYAISPKGTHGSGREISATHPAEQAYLPGWPARLPMLLTEVLPTIGGGVSTQAAIGDVDGDGANEVVASSVSGQVKVLNGRGLSDYAVFGLPIAANWLNAPGSGTNSADASVIVAAFGGASVGRVGTPAAAALSDGPLDIAAPTSGLGRALDTLFTNSQDGDPHLTVWSGRDGAVRSGYPRVTSDIAFFVTPGIVDVDGDGHNEAVAGNGVHLLHAFGAGGGVPSGWPKLTGGWVVGTPTVGDWDGDGTAELAVVRRDGQLLVWDLPTASDRMGDWTRYGSSGRNDGFVGD